MRTSRALFPAVFRYLVSPNVRSCPTDQSQLGAFVGAIFAFMTGDKTGRKLAVFIGLACNLVGAVLQIASFHLPMMFVGRVINGFGMGKLIVTSCAGIISLTISRRHLLNLSSLSS